MRNDVFSSGPLVLRCPWDISADFEDTAANQRKKWPAVPGVTNYAALCSLQPGRPLIKFYKNVKRLFKIK